MNKYKLYNILVASFPNSTLMIYEGGYWEAWDYATVVERQGNLRIYSLGLVVTSSGYEEFK